MGMKECWFNVYQYPLTKEVWYGGYMASIEQADSNAINLDRVYRIHVRIK
jgi:hypothetical protein